MINAVMFETIVEVNIFGPNFSQDLERFKEDVPKEFRRFDQSKGVWVVLEPENQTAPYILKAIEMRKNQLDLF